MSHLAAGEGGCTEPSQASTPAPSLAGSTTVFMRVGALRCATRFRVHVGAESTGALAHVLVCLGVCAKAYLVITALVSACH